MIRTRRDAAREGSALLATLILLSTLMVMSLAFLQIGVGKSNQVSTVADDRATLLLAEAAVAEALTALRAGATGSVGSQALPASLGGGVVWTEHTDLGNGRHSVIAKAMRGSGRAALRVELQAPGEEIFPGMFSSKEAFSGSAKIFVDSYDSEVGSYASQAVNLQGAAPYANNQGHVFSDGDISFASDAIVLGDAHPGVGRSITISGSAYVDGSTTPLLEPLIFPPINPPPGASSGDLSLGLGASQALGPGVHTFDNLSLGKSASLTITGPADLVIEDFSTQDLAQIIVDGTAGPVTFFVADDFDYSKSTLVTSVNNTPTDIAWMVMGTDDVDFNSSTTLYGGFYAPNADVSFASSCEVFGSVSAKSIKMNSGVRFHFDEYLLRRRLESSGKPFEVLHWRLAGENEVPFRADRRDPLTVLGLTDTNLAGPSDSWVAATGSSPAVGGG